MLCVLRDRVLWTPGFGCNSIFSLLFYRPYLLTYWFVPYSCLCLHMFFLSIVFGTFFNEGSMVLGPSVYGTSMQYAITFLFSFVFSRRTPLSFLFLVLFP